MSLVTDVVMFLMVLPLGIWLGAMVFFSFIGAPEIFRALPDGQAGEVVSAIFPRYYVLGVWLGLAGFIAGILYGVVVGFGLQLGVVFLFVLLGVVAASYARWVLLPRMDQAGEDAFERYHRWSVILNGFTMVVVAVAILAVQRLP